MLGSCCPQASVSPGDSGLVTVVGTGVLKVFKLSEQTLKPLPLNANRRDTLSFTCQAWVPLGDKGADGAGGGSSAAAAGQDAAKGAAGSSDRERQLLGTVDGEILLFEVCVEASNVQGLIHGMAGSSCNLCKVCVGRSH